MGASLDPVLMMMMQLQYSKTCSVEGSGEDDLLCGARIHL